MRGNEIDEVFDETRRLIAEEARLRQELGLSRGPSFHEYWVMTGDQRTREDAKLLREILQSEDDAPDGPPGP